MKHKLFGRKKAEPEAPKATETETAADDNEITAETIDAMSDEEFSKYLDEISLSDTGSEDEAEEALTEEDETSPSEETTAEDADSEGEAEDEAEDEEKKPPAPFKTFDTEEDFEKAVSARVSEELSKNKPQDEAEISRIRELADMFYKGSESPLSDVADELERQYAESEGTDVETLRSRMSTERDAKKWRDDKKRKDDANTKRDDIIKKWESEEEGLRHIDKDFSLKEAFKDEGFKSALLNGKSVFEAYAEMTDKQSEAKAEDPPGDTLDKEPEKREPIMQNMAAAEKGTGEGRKNPATLSDKEFKKYISDIKNR